MRILSDNQQAAIEKLARLKVGALFMGCGTGKTQAAISLINTVNDLDLVLWVCPCRTIENVKREFNECESRYPIEVVGVESIGLSDRIFLETLEKVKSHRHTFIVVDESLKIKNIRAKRTKRLLQIGDHAEYKLILNGTPVTKNLLDIYPQMLFLSPRILNMSYREFKYTYCIVKEKKVLGRVVKSWVTGYANVEHLLSIIEPYVYECTLDLSLKKSYSTVYWEMTDDEREDYESLKSELFAVFKEDGNILGIFSKLQHFYSLCSDKFTTIDKLVNDKTIIFCRFIKTAEVLREKYPQALILTYGKSSFGLNLQAYNRTIYFDKTWDFAFREQSEARTYRTGQQNNCEYVDVTGNVGLETLFDDCIKKKLSLVEAFKLKGNNLMCL